MIALRQVGGVVGPLARWRLRRARDCAPGACASARLRGRPRRLVSIRPPWVPRCLRRRFFLVWATARNLIGRGLAEPPLDHVLGRVEAADRQVLRVARQRRLGHQADQLGLDGPGAVRRGELA